MPFRITVPIACPVFVILSITILSRDMLETKRDKICFSCAFIAKIHVGAKQQIQISKVFFFFFLV